MKQICKAVRQFLTGMERGPAVASRAPRYYGSVSRVVGILLRMKTKAIRNSMRSAPSRSIWIGNHKTSVRLEPTMWAALNDIPAERGKTVHDVVLEINRGRKGIGLTAAIRVFIVEYYREALERCRKEKAPPKRGKVWKTRLDETRAVPCGSTACNASVIGSTHIEGGSLRPTKQQPNALIRWDLGLARVF
jgi:predicted DNA-binding ribbon-helix-helix protein